MIGLLDVNVLVALFDPQHVHHRAAHDWFGQHRTAGWATCPMTETGLIRVLASPSYPGRRTTIMDATERLTAFRDSGDHVFWPDSISWIEPGEFDLRHVRGHRQLTDVYLLALSKTNGGRLVTLDRSIQARSVVGATADHLAVIGSA